MKSRLFITSLIAMSLAISPVLAKKGFGGGPSEKQGKDYHRKMMCEKLDLSEEQQEKIEKLHEERKDRRKEHFSQIKGIKDKMKEELLKEKPDKTALYDYSGKITELQSKMSKERVDHLLEMKKVLDKDQFSKLLDFDRKMKERHHKGTKCKNKPCPKKM